jgi:hypothetical protein
VFAIKNPMKRISDPGMGIFDIISIVAEKLIEKLQHRLIQILNRLSRQLS